MQQAAPNVEELFFAALELEEPGGPLGVPRQGLRRYGAAASRRASSSPSTPEASDFLEAPASMPTVTAAHDSRPGVEEPGTVIGPYKLLEPIGEGGMGVVYMAEQAEPVRRRVALKVIKPGMDTKQVVARFEAERQALAMMDHPNIAKVLDAGTTAVGPPLLRDGAGPRPAHHRVLRPRAALDPRAAGAVRAGLPGGAARPPEGRSSTATSSPRTSW